MIVTKGFIEDDFGKTLAIITEPSVERELRDIIEFYETHKVKEHLLDDFDAFIKETVEDAIQTSGFADKITKAIIFAYNDA